MAKYSVALSDTIKKNRQPLTQCPTAKLSSLKISSGLTKSKNKEKMPGSKK